MTGQSLQDSVSLVLNGCKNVHKIHRLCYFLIKWHFPSKFFFFVFQTKIGTKLVNCALSMWWGYGLTKSPGRGRELKVKSSLSLMRLRKWRLLLHTEQPTVLVFLLVTPTAGLVFCENSKKLRIPMPVKLLAFRGRLVTQGWVLVTLLT